MVNQRIDPKIYRIKVTLRGSQPAIWRRFLTKDDTSLDMLHEILQCAMGWEDSHLHQFTIRGKRYGMCDEDESERLLDENEFRLCDVISRGRFEYLYMTSATTGSTRSK